MAVIEVYADIWCPFAHVGLRTVRERRRALGHGAVGLLVHAWPLELVNGRPQDAGVTAAHVRELRDQLSEELFVGFDVEKFPSTTLPALALAARAYRESDSLGEALSFALRDELFEEGADISDPAALGDIAERHGVPEVQECDRERVLEDWRQGQIRGVQGSPHFFCGERNVFCPALDIEKADDGRLLIERNYQALNGFLGDCFGG